MKFYFLYLFLIYIFLLFSSELFGREIEKIASFDAWKGGVSVGDNGRVRVINNMGLRYVRTYEDTLELQSRNPGWKGENYRYDDYEWNEREFDRISGDYWDGGYSIALPGDTIDDEDEKKFGDDTTRIEIPLGLPEKILSQIDRVRYFAKADIDCDDQEENILVFTEDEESESWRPPLRVMIYNISSDEKQSDKNFEIKYMEVISKGGVLGPPEIRDMTNDGCPEFVLRMFWPGGSGYSNTVYVYGLSADLDSSIFLKSTPSEEREIRQIGQFEAFDGPIFIGSNGEVTEMNGDINGLERITNLTQLGNDFPHQISSMELYPGWNGKEFHFHEYQWNGTSFKKIAEGRSSVPHLFSQPGDTVYTYLSHFDQQNKDTIHFYFARFDYHNNWSFDFSAELPEKILPKVDKIKHYKEEDIDCDGEKEKVLVYTEKSDYLGFYGSAFVLMIYNIRGEKVLLKLRRKFPETVATGPLEIRDITGDGCPEVIFRSIWDVDIQQANIYSAHKVPKSEGSKSGK